MTTFLIATAAALATALVLVAALLLTRPSRDRAVRELVAALERAERERQRAQTVAELARTIELGEVMTRTLEAARRLPGVDAASVTVATRSGEVIVTDGAADEEAADAIVLPLVSADEQVGRLGAYGRDRSALADARADLEELAHVAAPILDNARRFGEARQLADLDALTGLHNQRYFHETLAREVARARRYGRSLALIVLDLDDFKLINDRIGHLAGDEVLAETAERLREAVRKVDIPCRVGGDEFAVILPESALGEADQLYERISAAVSTEPVSAGGVVRLSAGVTELRPDDDATKLFQRADVALYQAKGAGKGTAVAVAALPGPELRPLAEPASGGEA